MQLQREACCRDQAGATQDGRAIIVCLSAKDSHNRQSAEKETAHGRESGTVPKDFHTKYEATWTYTGSTATMTLTGTGKDDGRTIEYTASIEQKGTQMTLYVVLKHVDDDKFTVELYA